MKLPSSAILIEENIKKIEEADLSIDAIRVIL